MGSAVKILPSALVNQIAAGEVVERPVSVVKELVENALDAGATQISVEFKNAGKDLISVLDNGSGMNEQDLTLSIERHATSKISSFEDLNQIASFGFRGEALAAIASVCRIEVISSQDEKKGGNILRLEGGKLVYQGKVGFPRGTRVQVEDLFFNTPARLKFLKSDRVESSRIFDWLQKIAVAHPEVAFHITHHRQSQVFPTSETMRQRLQYILPKELFQNLLLVDEKDAHYGIYGYILRPEFSKEVRSHQWLYINRRFIQSYVLARGIYQGLHSLLMKNRHPIFFLNLTVRPDELDVNVHPAKTEVKVHNEPLLLTFLAESIRSAIRKFNQSNSSSKILALPDDSPSLAPSSTASSTQPFAQTLSGRAQSEDRAVQANPLNKPSQARQPSEPTASAAAQDRPADTQPAPTPAPALAEEALASSDRADQGRSDFVGGKTEANQLETSALKVDAPVENRPLQLKTSTFQTRPNNSSSSLQPELSLHPRENARTPLNSPEALLANFPSETLKVLGRFDKYIVASKKDSLWLIDAHAAHERVLYEEIKQAFSEKKVPATPFLQPVLLKLAPFEQFILELHPDFWEELGFELRDLGRNEYALMAMPSLILEKALTQTSPEELIHSMFEDLAAFEKTRTLDGLYHNVFASLACHSAIRGQEEVSLAEMQAIVDRLQNFDLDQYCPHGRPVVMKYSTKDLDKMFKRI